MSTTEAQRPNIINEVKNWVTAPRDLMPDLIDYQVEKYWRALDGSGLSTIYWMALRMYYGFDQDGGWKNSQAITFGGAEGELTLLRVNEFRNLLTHVLTMTTSSRPAFQATAINDDFKAQSQAELAEGLVDFYLDEKGLEDVDARTAEMAGLLGQAWTAIFWDANAGEPYSVGERPVYDDDGDPMYETIQVEQIDPLTGALTFVEEEKPITEQYAVKTGDIVAKTFTPLDIVRDMTRMDDDDNWYIICEPMNRWDAVALFPEHRASIEAAPSINATTKGTIWDKWRALLGKTDSDEIWTRRLFHKKTPAVPEGRHTLIIGDKAVMDGPLPYPDIPLYAMTPMREFRSPSGYASAWDTMSLNTALDSCVSTMLSNHDAFALQNLLEPEGSDLTLEESSGGLRRWKYNPTVGTPTTLQLCQISPDSYRLTDMFRNMMQTLMGINSVVRGDPESSLKSGAALALVQAVAVQFNSLYQRAYARMLEKSMTGLVRTLQLFAKAPMLAEIAGEDQKREVIQFKGDDLSHVRRIRVDLGNPLMRTAAGRVQLADALLERGTINANQYLTVISTGRLKPITKGPDAKMSLIYDENERLARGEMVDVFLYEDHRIHFQEHISMIGSVEVKQDQSLMSALDQHLLKHIEAAGKMGINIAQLTGQEPFMGQPPMLPQPSGEAPPIPPANAAGVPGNMATGEPQLDQARAGMPRMPTNPMTGQPAQVGG